MSPDWSIGHASDEQGRLLDQPFRADALSLVMRGEDRFGTWELRDGPHPLIQDPAAVGHELLTRHPDGSGGDGGVGPRLRPDEVAILALSASSVGGHRIGYIQARCATSVTLVRVRYDDGSATDLRPVRSSSTGECWIVCALDSPRLLNRVEFVDDQGTVLDSRTVTDPRTPRQSRLPRPGRHDGDA